MSFLRTVCLIVPMSALLAGSVSANDVECDGMLSELYMDGNVIVTGDCLIEDSTINGNIIQATEGESWSITVLHSTVYGNNIPKYDEHQRYRYENTEVDSLARIAANEFRVAGAIMPGSDRRDRHQCAEADRKAEKPDTAADSDGSQRFGTQPSRHYRICEMHARNRQVVDDKRPGKPE